MDKPRVRLDVVVELRERSAQRALESLASAQREVASARSDVELARQRLLQDERQAGNADFWALADVAQGRARTAVKVAEHRVSELERVAAQAHEIAAHAERQRQAMERAAESQRSRVHAEHQRKERRVTDELAVVMFGQRRSA